MMGPAGAQLIVASQMGQKLDFFDVATLEKLDTIEDLIAQPHEIAWDPGRRLAYMTHTYRSGAYGEGKPKAHELSVIDPDRHAITDVIDISPYRAPHDIEFDHVNDLIYTSVEEEDGHNGLVIVDAGTRKVVGNIALKAPNSHWFCVTPDFTKAYVTHKDAPVISVVDLVARRQVGEIASPAGAEEIDCSPDGRYVFAASPMMSLTVNVSQGKLVKRTPEPGTPDPRVLKIDTATDAIVGQLDFTEFVSAIRVAPDGRVIVSEMHFPDPDAADTGPVAGRVHVIDPETMQLLASVTAEELPFTVRCSPDASTAFVANLKTGSVTVIALDDYRVLATLDNNVGPVFGGSHGLCWVPAAS